MKKLTVIFGIIFYAAISMPVYADTAILPHRVIDTKTMTFIDFEGLLSRCSEANIVTLGENHDDPGTHLIELAILEGLHRYNPKVILTMEMFERDVQEYLDEYLAGEISEDEFLENSRPWGNYDTDYRPMVEFAKDNSLKVIAANCPRVLASRAGQMGYENAEWTDEEKNWIAATFEATRDAYWDKFLNIMLMMGEEHGGNMGEDMIALMYQAQVLKDETMAESITSAWQAQQDAIVYHINGNFHTGDYLGTFSRIGRNAPDADAVSIVAVPVENLLEMPPDDTPMADYWILVLAPEEVEEISEAETLEEVEEEKPMFPTNRRN